MSRLRNCVLLGDARARLQELPSGSVDMVLTSPPYYQLRDYQAAGQLGVEAGVTDWVSGLRDVLREVKRVMVPTGTLWLNVGDSYAVHPSQGGPRKSLLLGPERLLLDLLADGWIVRNKIVWQKANPMPTSIADRFACTWEYLYVLAKQPRYYFDLDSVRVPHTSRPSPGRRRRAVTTRTDAHRGRNSAGTSGLRNLKRRRLVGHPLGKNPGDVLTLASSNYRGGHRATFPVTLAERAILAGCPERRCAVCRLPYRRRVIRALGGTAVRSSLAASCDCQGRSEPGLVLDPFMGAGTTAVAAEALARDWLGIELNGAYVHEAHERIRQVDRAAA